MHADEPRSDPALSAAVERARELAEATGEVQTSPWSGPVSALSPEAREIVAWWVRDGGYERALADVVANDADLADQ